MGDAIIVLNAGSSNLKFSIFQVYPDDVTCITRGEIQGLGSTPRFRARHRTRGVLADEEIPSSAGQSAAPPHSNKHLDALAYLNRWLREEFAGALSPIAVGHRVAHGGLQFVEPTSINQQVIEKLTQLVPLSPQRQPHHLSAIKAASELLPGLPQVACFDTGFHHGRTTVTQRFGLPDDLFKGGVRRWGTHGLSYASVVDQLRESAPDLLAGRIVIAHLGRSASMCAIRGGRSVDTSGGFSAIDGLPAGTRCGSLDPGALLFLLQSKTQREIETLLQRESGLLGISGVSGDLRELLASQNPRAADAVEFFVYRAVREIGSLTAALGGLDALVFTGGVGEGSALIRQRICDPLGWLGLAVEKTANERGRGCISPTGRSPAVWVMPSEADRFIATATWAAVRKSVPVPAGRTPTFVEGIN